MRWFPTIIGLAVGIGMWTFLTSGLFNLSRPFQASAAPPQAGSPVEVFIRPAEPTAIFARFRYGTSRRILTIGQLPRTSRKGLGIAAQRFSGAALSPDRARTAFATLGRVHGWVGILHLGTLGIRELSVFFEGHAADLRWSPNGRYLALTDHGASGLREVAVYDVRSRAALRGFAGLIDMEFFQRNVDTFAPVWTVDSRRVRFKAWAAGTTKPIETSVAASSGPFPIATRSVVAVFIPKGERTALYLRFANGSARRILTVAQLPKTSRSGLGMDAQGFSGAALAPDPGRVAFATLGQVHGWVGLLSLRTGAVREFDFFYGGHATDLAWSPNGRFIALTDDGPSGIREVAAYLVESGKPVSTFGALIDRRFFQKEIETYAPVWSDDSRSLRFKAKGPGSASRIETWEALLDGTRLRRVAP